MTTTSDNNKNDNSSDDNDYFDDNADDATDHDDNAQWAEIVLKWRSQFIDINLFPMSSGVKRASKKSSAEQAIEWADEHMATVLDGPIAFGKGILKINSHLQKMTTNVCNRQAESRNDYSWWQQQKLQWW